VLKRRLLKQGKEPVFVKKDEKNNNDAVDMDSLKQEVADFQRQITRLNMEKDILEGTAVLLKKEGASIRCC